MKTKAGYNDMKALKGIQWLLSLPNWSLCSWIGGYISYLCYPNATRATNILHWITKSVDSFSSLFMLAVRMFHL